MWPILVNLYSDAHVIFLGLETLFTLEAIRVLSWSQE